MSKKFTKKSGVQKQTQSFFSKIALKESYVSMFLGALAVVIVVFISISFIEVNKIQDTDKQVSSTSTALSVPPVISETPDKNKQTLPEKYTVKPGDSLWTISEKVYGSGYNWVDIARANNISNPGIIFSGNQLKIPNVKTITIETQIAPQAITTQAEGAIFGSTYTVVRGDNLWDIAVRAYGDGYKWIDIAKVNNLANPDLIFSENILKLPR